MHYSILNVDSGRPFCPRGLSAEWEREKSPGLRAKFEIGSVVVVKRASPFINRDRNSEFDSSPWVFGSGSPGGWRANVSEWISWQVGWKGGGWCILDLVSPSLVSVIRTSMCLHHICCLGVCQKCKCQKGSLWEIKMCFTLIKMELWKKKDRFVWEAALHWIVKRDCGSK